MGGVHAPPVYQSPAARAFPLSPPLFFFFIICVLTPCNIVCVLLFFLCDRPWRQPTWRQGGGRVFPHFALSLFIFSSFFFLSPLYHRHWRQPTWRHGASALCLFIFSFLFFPPLPQALEAVIVFRTLSDD